MILNEAGEIVVFEMERLMWTEAERALYFKLQQETPLVLGGIPILPSDPLMPIELEPKIAKILEEELPYDGVLTFWVYNFPAGLSGLVSIHVLVNDEELRPPMTGDYETRSEPLCHSFKKGDVLKVELANYDVKHGHRPAIRFYSIPSDPCYNFVKTFSKPCRFDLPSGSGGIFCTDEQLYEDCVDDERMKNNWMCWRDGILHRSLWEKRSSKYDSDL